MTSRNIFIVLFVLCAAYFMAACSSEPGLVPGVCFYDYSGPEGCGTLEDQNPDPLVTCREQHIGFLNDCASGSIEPPASCSNGTPVPIGGLDCVTAANYPGQPQVPLYSTCTMADGVDYYGWGDCEPDGAAKAACDAAGGQFDCL